jgi:hypothetical protein
MKTALICLASLLVLGGIAFGIAAYVIGSSWDNDGFFGDCFYGDTSSACDPPASYGSSYATAALTLQLRSTFNRHTNKLCVTATVADTTGERVSDATVRFSAPAANAKARPMKGTRLTDLVGLATFSTASTPFGPRMRVFVDEDDSGRRDAGEPSKLG